MDALSLAVGFALGVIAVVFALAIASGARSRGLDELRQTCPPPSNVRRIR